MCSLLELEQHTLIVICGPTAVGKTDLAIKLAQYFQTSVISSDSRQCFKELEIAVSKPTNIELETVQHYFINSHHITEEVNAAIFEQFATKAIKEIFTKSNVAIMVGGTGLYINAFCYGLDETPPIDKNVRDWVRESYEKKGLGWLQDEIKIVDPDFWNIAEQQNPHRLMRALEISVSQKKSVLEFRNANKKSHPFKIINIGIEMDRQNLIERIDSRVDKMINSGLIEEVRHLTPFRNLNALQTVGYKEMFAYLDGSTTFDAAIDDIKTNTRKYAKRQMTWFKKDKNIHWFSQGNQLYNELISFLFTIKG